MRRYRFYTVDVFTNAVFSGNPLAVLPEADGLSTTQMQSIAREFNLSETVFVAPPVDPAHARRLRIFTPRTELPFAGHPTLGAAYVLAATGAVGLAGERTEVIFEEGVGPVAVTIAAVAGQPDALYLTAAQRPTFGPTPPDRATLAAVLSLAEIDLEVPTAAPAAVSCGVPFLITPARDREALRRAAVDRAAWERALRTFWAPHLYVICLDPDPAAPIHARMFAPALGVEEDPATGAAAVALAGYLSARYPAADGVLRWTVAQGVEMGRPSRLLVEAERRRGCVVAARVGGQAAPVSEGVITVPDGG